MARGRMVSGKPRAKRGACSAKQGIFAEAGNPAPRVGTPDRAMTALHMSYGTGGIRSINRMGRHWAGGSRRRVSGRYRRHRGSTPRTPALYDFVRRPGVVKPLRGKGVAQTAGKHIGLTNRQHRLPVVQGQPGIHLCHTRNTRVDVCGALYGETHGPEETSSIKLVWGGKPCGLVCTETFLVPLAPVMAWGFSILYSVRLRVVPGDAMQRTTEAYRPPVRQPRGNADWPT